MPAPTESAVQNVRAEWVPSDRSSGTPRPPTDPSWRRFGDYIASYPGWDGDAGTEGQQPAGSAGPTHHFRGAEEHDLSIQWWLQRFFVDAAGDANDPIGSLINWSNGEAFPAHEVLIRREVAEGGVLGGGFREFVVASGCKPSSASLPGDPSESQPIVAEVGYAAELVRSYIVHQPTDGNTVTPQVKSTSANDTGQTVTIESEGASTSDTFSLNGTTQVSGASGASFGDIDAVRIDGDHEGDIIVEDGSGTQLVEDGAGNGITGSQADGVQSFRGIPLLGSGSHASEIGTDPESYLFLGTSSTFAGGALADSAPSDRIHAFDFDAEIDLERDARQGTRRQAIDPTTRTVTVEADVAGPHESAAQSARYYRGTEGDIVYTLPDGDLTLRNATPTDTDEWEREGGDGRIIYGVTFTASNDAGSAIDATHN